jgi:hypothetical protein
LQRAPVLPPRDPIAAPTPSFNRHVVALLDEYPAGGFGGYAWPSAPGASGTTRDLAVGDTVVARSGPGNHCVGVTLEVFWRALAACPGEFALDAASAKRLKTTWYVPEDGGTGAIEALLAHRLGERVALDDALPGDFVQAWSTSGLGHSMVFLGWTRDATGTITGIRYWSSQPWTDGIGIAETPIGDAGTEPAAIGFDRAQVYVARAACR